MEYIVFYQVFIPIANSYIAQYKKIKQKTNENLSDTMKRNKIDPMAVAFVLELQGKIKEINKWK